MPSDSQPAAAMATRLQAVQARLTATMEALFDFLFVIDREDRILDFHSPIPERLYIPPEQFLNRRYQDILPPEASAVIAAAIEQARAQGSSRGFVYSLPYPDGQHYFELSIAPVGDPASPEGSILFIAREITAQKQAEAALQESEARFAQCARESRTYIWEVDADGLYTYLSPAVEDVLGYRPEELVGHQHFYDLHPEADRNALREAAFEIFQQRGLFRHFQSRALAKNGQEVWISTSGHPRLDDAGNLRGYRGSDIDITPLKQVEEALRESEARRNAIDDNLPGGMVFQMDSGPDGRQRSFNFMSQGVLHLHGFTPGEALQNPGLFYRQLLEEDRARLAERQAQAFAAMAPFQIEVRFRLPNGRIRWGNLSSAPRRLPDGRVVWDGIETDITARKAMEAAQRQAETKYRTLFENLRDPFVVVDMQGRILEHNELFAELTGYSAEELARLTYQDLTPEKWHGGEADIVRTQVLVHGYSEVYEKEYRRKDGTIVPISLRTVLQRDAAGQPATMWALIHDISSRKHAEEQLRKSEAQYRLLVESMREAFAVTGLDTRLTEANPALEALTGYSRQELLSMTSRQIASAHWHPLIQQIRDEQILTRGYSDEFQIEIVHKSGVLVPVEVRAMLLRDDAGRPAAIWAIFRDIAERQRGEQELSRSRDLLEVTQRLARVGGWEWDVARQTMYWTGETYRIHGMPAGELAAGSPEHIERSLACYDPEVRSVVADAFRRCVAEGQPYDLEFPLSRMDGQRIWIRTMANAIKDGDRITKVVGTIMDISERKRAENFLRLVLDLIPAGVFWKDRNSVFLGCNQTIARAAGLASPAQIVGKTDHDLGWKKEESDYFVAMDRWVMENDQPEMHIIEPQLQADGAEKWIDTCKIPLHDEDGRVNGILGAFLDITVHRNLEQALRSLASQLEQRVQERTAELEASRQALLHSEERFRQMAEHSQEVIWLIDVKARTILYASPAFERIWGSPTPPPGAEVGVWLDTIHPDDRERVYRHFMTGLAAGHVPPVEYRIVRPDGAGVWISVTSSVISGADGTPERLVGVSRNITDQRHLEAEVLRASEAERQRLGRDLHDDLGQSLTAIGYLAEALHRNLTRDARPEASDAGRIVQLLAKTSHHAHAVAQGLLVTDLDRGGLVLALQELAEGIGELYGLECRYEGPARITLPGADAASQLYRIAQEAANNAAKHSKGRQIVFRLAKESGHLSLAISDNGRGLVQDGNGTNGLGLDIMRYRAGIIGGELSIVGVPGQGTTVTCRLPLPAPSRRRKT